MLFICVCGGVMYTFTQFVCNLVLYDICWWKSTHLPQILRTATSKQYLLSSFNYRFAGVCTYICLMKVEVFCAPFCPIWTIHLLSRSSVLLIPFSFVAIFSWVFYFYHLALNEQPTSYNKKLSPCYVFSLICEVLLLLYSNHSQKSVLSCY